MTTPSRSRVLYRRGSVYTPADPFATALLVEDGVVAWVGSDDAAASMASVSSGGGETAVVDLDGALVTPAFVDAHAHVTETGLALEGLDLREAASSAQLLDAVARAHRLRRGSSDEPGPASPTILGHGWDDTAWPDALPTRGELERAAPGAEVYLSRVDVHSALVSSSLAVRAGIDADPAGSARVVLADHHAARDATRRLTPGQRTRAHTAALRAAAAAGIGCVHENSAPHVGSGEDLRALLDLAAAGALPSGGGEAPGPLPTVLALWGEAVRDADEARAVVQGLGLGPEHEAAFVGLAGDLVVDGSLGSRTAALLAPYADGTPSPAPYLDAEAIAAHLVACTSAGFTGGFHVIGDGALAELVAGLRSAEAALGRLALSGARHRVEHAEMLGAADVDVLAALGITVSSQPAFDAAWGGPHGMYADRVGTGRAAAMNDLAALVTAGVPLALGSDSPVTPFAPWEAVRAAAFPHEAGHATTARAAFLAHTRGGWRAAGRDGVGALVPGAPATLAVWEPGDLLVQTPDARVAGWSTDVRSGTPGLPDLTPGVPAPLCLRTVVDGRVVHDRL